ncbi:MAG: YfhO family protein [Clostridia bacterium]|nr:YfhO family protein [Clostridia bacterium]
MKFNSDVAKNGLLKCGNRCKSIFSEYWYILIAALIPAVLVYLMYLARGLYPFGNGCVLVLDLNGQYVYFFEALRNFVVNGDTSIIYSFSRALGGEFMGIYEYYIASPFSYLVCLFPEDRMCEALLFMFMVKAGFCAGTMAFYLHKSEARINRIGIIAFSVMYSLMSYCITQQNNTMWIDAVIWFPLVMYGVEQLIKYGKYRIFVVFLTLTLVSNYYIGYMVCISVAIYFFAYLWGFKHSNNPYNERLHGIRSFMRIAFYSILAIGISAFIIFTAYYSLTFGKTDFSTPNWAFTSRFNFLELFYKFLPSSYDTVRPAGLPFVYCGVLTLLMVPMFFFNRKFRTGEKVAYAVLITIFVFSFVTSSIDLVWHGFQKPNWLNNRYSFMICFFLIVMAYRAFTNLRTTSRKPMIAVGAIIGLGVIVLQEFSPMIKEDLNEYIDVHDFQTVWLTIGCLIVYTIIVCLMPRVKNKELVSCVLVFFVCVETFISGLCDLNDLDKDVTFTKYSYYNDYLDTVRPIINTVQENDTSFYRMEKTYHRKLNDNLALQIRGLSNSTSTLNADTIYFLRMMGYSSKSHWSQYQGETPVSDSLLGIKYIMTDKDYDKYYGEPRFDSDDYDNETYVVYQNPYVMSIAYAVDEDFAKFQLDDYENPFERMNAMISMMLGEEETLQIFVPGKQLSMKTKDVTKSTAAKHDLYKGDGGTITFEYEVPKHTELFVYFPTVYSRSVNMTANGKSVGKWGDNNTWRIVSIGSVDKKDLELKLTIKNDYDNFYLQQDLQKPFIYSLDMEVFTEAITRLQQGNVQIDPDHYREDYLPGTITTTKEHQLITTTIPFDKGWQIKVDGKKVETFELANALVGYYIEDAGEHTVEMHYCPKELVLGTAISIISVIVFFLLIIFEKKLRSIRGYGEFFGIPEPVAVKDPILDLPEPEECGYPPEYFADQSTDQTTPNE